jgi:hypothetical protein
MIYKKEIWNLIITLFLIWKSRKNKVWRNQKDEFNLQIITWWYFLGNMEWSK